MARKNEDAGAVVGGGKGKAKAKAKAGDGGRNVKKERISVSGFLNSLDKAKDEVPMKSKPKPVVGANVPKKVHVATTSAYFDMDMPPEVEDEEEKMDSEEEADLHLKRIKRKVGLDLTVMSNKTANKKEKEMIAAQAAEIARHEAMKEDKDVFTVTIGAKTSTLEGGAENGTKDIKIENFSVSVRGNDLLKNASITIVHGRRYGLVGPNGTGKSTLLKLLSRRQIPVPKNIDMLLVEQEVMGDEKTALESVVSADEVIIRLREEATRLQNLTEFDDTVGERLSDVFENLQLRGTDVAEPRASKILAGLGFSVSMQGRATKSFSGGWRMRISLARALFMQPTLLLLDEPTNHLDLRAVMWLEQYLRSWKKTLIVVSHDREFLNSVSTDIIHLHDHKLLTYKGNFDIFEDMYEQKLRENNKKYHVYEKQLKAAKRNGSKAQQDKVKDHAKLVAGKDAKAKGKSKYINDDDDDIAPLEAPRRWPDYRVEFHFPEPTKLKPGPLLQLSDVGFAYPGRSDFALKKIDVGVDMGTRVAIVGPNGAGKSTLLKLLAGDLQPTEGESRHSQKLRVGQYSQHFVDSLTMEETPVQYLVRLYPDLEGPNIEQTVRAKLGKFGIPKSNHLTPIVKLSGGQKARVVLTSIMMARPHLLLLDEPTNHLDMQSIDGLADALDEFTGGVVLVSHDARLISRVCENEEKSEVWVVEDGSVRKFHGNFDDYKRALTEEIKAEVDD